MKRIFLSASVPMPNRGNFHESADPFLIQFAVRELLTVCLGRRLIVWGGHPAITPMVWSVCEDLGVEYAKTVSLYQSEYFAELYPDENRKFSNVTYTKAIDRDREKSLRRMRSKMFALKYDAAVFIGGMEGIFTEHALFSKIHPKAKVIAVSSPGGAALQLSEKLGTFEDRIDFAKFFYEKLEIDPTERRDQL